MNSRLLKLTLLWSVLTLLVASCPPASASSAVIDSPDPIIQAECPPDSAQDGACITPTAIPATQTPNFTATASPLPESSATPTASVTPLPPTATPCPPNLCSYAFPYFLQRPIALPGNDVVDATYRFGTTQGGRREPHHGVEFLNAYGTPVLAAADGKVLFAGEDREPISEPGVWPQIFYGPFSY